MPCGRPRRRHPGASSGCYPRARAAPPSKKPPASKVGSLAPLFCLVTASRRECGEDHSLGHNPVAHPSRGSTDPSSRERSRPRPPAGEASPLRRCPENAREGASRGLSGVPRYLVGPESFEGSRSHTARFFAGLPSREPQRERKGWGGQPPGQARRAQGPKPPLDCPRAAHVAPCFRRPVSPGCPPPAPTRRLPRNLRRLKWVASRPCFAWSGCSNENVRKVTNPDRKDLRPHFPPSPGQHPRAPSHGGEGHNPRGGAPGRPWEPPPPTLRHSRWGGGQMPRKTRVTGALAALWASPGVRDARGPPGLLWARSAPLPLLCDAPPRS